MEDTCLHSNWVTSARYCSQLLSHNVNIKRNEVILKRTIAWPPRLGPHHSRTRPVDAYVTHSINYCVSLTIRIIVYGWEWNCINEQLPKLRSSDRAPIQLYIGLVDWTDFFLFWNVILDVHFAPLIMKETGLLKDDNRDKLFNELLKWEREHHFSTRCLIVSRV